MFTELIQRKPSTSKHSSYNSCTNWDQEAVAQGRHACFSQPLHKAQISGFFIDKQARISSSHLSEPSVLFSVFGGKRKIRWCCERPGWHIYWAQECGSIQGTWISCGLIIAHLEIGMVVGFARVSMCVLNLQCYTCTWLNTHQRFSVLGLFIWNHQEERCKSWFKSFPA